MANRITNAVCHLNPVCTFSACPGYQDVAHLLFGVSGMMRSIRPIT